MAGMKIKATTIDELFNVTWQETLNFDLTKERKLLMSELCKNCGKPSTHQHEGEIESFPPVAFTDFYCDECCQHLRPLLTFKEVSEVNLHRSLLWHKGSLKNWTLTDWSNALAGETGEVCNAIKKLRRIETECQQAEGPKSRQEAVDKIAEELADVYFYLNLLSIVLGIDLETAIINKFNKVSEREGFPQRL